MYNKDFTYALLPAGGDAVAETVQSIDFFLFRLLESGVTLSVNRSIHRAKKTKKQKKLKKQKKETTHLESG